MEKSLDELLAMASGEDITPTEPTQPNNTSEGDNDGDKQPQPPVDDNTPADDKTPEDKAKDEGTAGSIPSDKKPEDDKKPNPMKEIRDRYNKEKKANELRENAIERLTNGDYKFSLKDFKNESGKVDYEALTKAMDDEDNKHKAEANNLTPEIQAAVDRLEREKQELQKERIKVAMDKAVSNMQIDLGLNREAINTFFKDAMDVGKNPYQWLAQGGSLQDLYNLIYREKLMKDAIEKAVAEEKAKWEKDHTSTPPISNPAAPADSSKKSDGLSLNDLLVEVGNK